MKLLHFVFILGLSAVLASCQTYSPVTPVSLPARTLHSFGSCWKDNGSINFSLFKDNAPVISASADWVHDNDGTWRWEIYDLLGRVVLSGEMANRQMRAKGQMAEEFSKLEIDGDDFIRYDSSSLSLKWKELNCFLAQRLPEEWIDLARSISTNSKGTDSVEIEDKDRSVELSFSKEKVCGTLRSRFLFFFRRERVSWCFSRNPQRAYLNFENVIRIEWTHSEEKEQEWTDYSR